MARGHGGRSHRPGRRAQLDRGVPRARRGWPERSCPLRRAGDRQDDPVGSGRRSGRDAPRPRSRAPKRRGGGLAVVHGALRPARAGLPGGGARRLHRCGGGRSRSRSCWPSPGTRLRTREPSGWPCSTSSRCSPSGGRSSSRSTTSSGSTRHRPVCCRSRYAACATSASACSRRVRTAPETTVPVELDRAFPAERLARLPIGPLEHGSAASPAPGASRSRSDPAGARPGSGGVGRQPVLRARARAGARPDELQTDLREGPAGAREPVRAPGRPPRPAPDRYRRRRPLRSGARPPDGRARHHGARAP